MSGIFDQVLSYNPTILASGISGSVNYKGTWDASTNSPALTNPPASTTKGWYYVVSTAGTQFGITFAVGDWIISNGSTWEKVDLTDSVSSVFGRTGAVASANGDYTASQVTNVPAGTISSTNVQDAINELSSDIATAQNVLDAYVTNAESVAITKGQVVYAFGATGNRMSVKLANNSSDATSAKTVGVVLDSSIAAGNPGYIRLVGVVDGLNLGAYADGDTLYLGATNGSVTATKPYAPNHLVYVGIVERANNGNGQLYVRVQNGYELDEIHDVQITSAPASGALLVRDATNSLWKAARLTAGTNIAVTNADASVTVGVSGIIASSNGGTGNGFTKFSGPTTSEKTFTLPDASATIHYEGGTIGATTANTGRFTTLTATSTISGSNLSGTNTGDQTISITGDVTAVGSTGALTATVGKINGVALIGLGTGILKNSTTTGQPSIAIASDFPTLNQNTTGTASNVTGTVAVGNGGTGATTLTGYVKGSGTAALTASSTIPNTDISGLGTMSTQAASSVAITGGSINNTPIGAATPNTGAFTTLTASTPIGTASGGTGVNTTPANGQVLIGNGTGYTANTLTAGTGISITNASGSITIAATGGSGAVSSVSGTANEITSSPTTGAVVLSLPSALTFTGKTVTGGTFNSGAFNGTVGATTASTGAFTTLTSSFLAASGPLASFSVAQGLYGYYSSGGVIGAYSNNTGTLASLTLNGSSIDVRPAGSTVGLFSTTGLAVTGTLSTTGVTLVNGAAGTSYSYKGLHATGPQFFGYDNVVGNGYGGGVRGYSVSAQGGYVALGTVQNNSWTAGLTIDHLNNVGIGTTTPLCKTEVYDSAVLGAFVPATRSTWRVLQIKNFQRTNSGSAAGISFQGDNANGDTGSAGIVGINNNTTGGVMSLAFLTASANVSVERVRIDSDGNVGIGTSSPATKLDVAGTTAAFGVAATGVNITIREYSASTARNWSIRDDSGVNRLRFSRGSTDQPFWDVTKVAASDQTSDQYWYTNGSQRMQLSSTGLSVTGALSCTGALSKGSGSFRIEHPLPEKSVTHQLVHSFIEGPQADLIYRGKVVLVDGKASVNIDAVATMTEGTFEVLCREVQCFTTNETGWTAVRGKVTGNILTIEAKDFDCTDEISWMVIGERKDPHMMETDWTDDNGKVIVEPLKPVAQPIE